MPVARKHGRGLMDCGASEVQLGGKPDDQVRKSLHKLRGKVRSCSLLLLGPELLSREPQEEVPCEDGEGPRANEKVVRLSGS